MEIRITPGRLAVACSAWRIRYPHLRRVPGPAFREAIEAAYRALAQKRHPNRPGGLHDLRADLNRSCDAALKEKGVGSAA